MNSKKIPLRMATLLTMIVVAFSLSAQNPTGWDPKNGKLDPNKPIGSGKPHAPSNDFVMYYYEDGVMWFDLPNNVQTVTVCIETANQTPQLYYNVDEFTRLTLNLAPATYTITATTVLGKDYTGTLTLS